MIPIKVMIAKKVFSVIGKKILKKKISNGIGFNLNKLGFLGKFSPKAGIILFLIIALAGSHFLIYNKGKRVERAAHEQRLHAALELQRQETQRIQSEEIRIIERSMKAEREIAERMREIDISVPTPNCTNLDDDWLREYNRAISAASDS